MKCETGRPTFRQSLQRVVVHFESLGMSKGTTIANTPTNTAMKTITWRGVTVAVAVAAAAATADIAARITATRILIPAFYHRGFQSEPLPQDSK